MTIVVLVIIGLLTWFMLAAFYWALCAVGSRKITHCECGELLEGQYPRGEWHHECAVCRAGALEDAREWT